MEITAGQLLNKRLAQTAIEFVLGVVVLFIFFVGALKAFVWVNKTMVERQENYEALRTLAGNNEVMRSDWVKDEDTNYALGHEIVKEVVVNHFYNANSGLLGDGLKAFNLIDPRTKINSYKPLDIFHEEDN